MSNLDAIRQRILTDDDFVLSEVRKLQYTFGLKREIRYGLNRGKLIDTESVAEHIYGMQVLADYFLQCDTNNLTQSTVYRTITWHDMDELKTGDTISWKKTNQQIKEEKSAYLEVVPELPDIIQTCVAKCVEAYENHSTPEARFVKALDKIEPLFHLYTTAGKTWCIQVGLTRHDSERIKKGYTEQYPCLHRFVEVLHKAMEREGFFN